MKNLFRSLRRAVQQTNGTHLPEPERPDLGAEIATIQRAEAATPIEPGKRIHSFPVQELDLRLDRDVLGHYRITAWAGRERQYSFTVACAPGDYDELQRNFEEILHFLEGDRRPADLPDHAGLKGHLYGM